jgi:hypothetical protein
MLRRLATPAKVMLTGLPAGKKVGEDMNLEKSKIYKAHRIHPTRLTSGSWITSIVKLGVPKEGNAGPPVERIWGDYPSEDAAISAAKQYIDQLEDPQAR